MASRPPTQIKAKNNNPPFIRSSYFLIHIILLTIIFMSSSSESPRRSPQPEEKPTPHKIFATNLDVEVEPAQLETQLFTMFSKYGKLDSVVVKRSYNNKYCFAFIEYKEGEDATQAVHDLNNTPINGKKIKVELQDNARRRKGPEESRAAPRSDGCYVCGKTGHIAKNCRENREREERQRRRSPSSQEREKRKSKKHRRHSSSSSSRSRRDRKERSRKIKKSKHRSRRHSSSSSS